MPPSPRSKAEALGVRINVGVAGASGNLVAFLRMPGAFPQSIAIAIDKAYPPPAASASRPGSVDGRVRRQRGMKLGFSAQPRLVVFGGDCLIRVGGELVGGIGVSGTSEDQDGICARAGRSRSAPTTSSPSGEFFFVRTAGISRLRSCGGPSLPSPRTVARPAFPETTQPQRKRRA